MNKITVTSPLLPPLEELIPYLEDIWEKKWLTNNGYYHQLLENKLCDYLGVNYISLFSNGTLALLAAIQALELKGEIITTPYSFVATSHAIIYNIGAIKIVKTNSFQRLVVISIDKILATKQERILNNHSGISIFN